MEIVEKNLDTIIQMGLQYAPKLALALITLLIGFWMIGRVGRLIDSQFEKRDLDPSLRTFSVSMIGVILKVLLVISVAGMVGIETTSFVAIIGAAGLAVGLALQGSLSNFAGSVLILIFKPFKVGDVIDVAGRIGTVKEIQIFATVMRTTDNKRVIIPNGVLAGGTIVNLSAEDTRRIDLVFGIGYNDDIDKAKEVLKAIIAKDERILSEPEPTVAVSELADSSVNFVFRPWVKKDDYWPVYYDMVETVKKTFDKEDISIPFPQRDVHLHQVQ